MNIEMMFRHPDDSIDLTDIVIEHGINEDTGVTIYLAHGLVVAIVKETSAKRSVVKVTFG